MPLIIPAEFKQSQPTNWTDIDNKIEYHVDPDGLHRWHMMKPLELQESTMYRIGKLTTGETVLVATWQDIRDRIKESIATGKPCSEGMPKKVVPPAYKDLIPDSIVEVEE